MKHIEFTSSVSYFSNPFEAVALHRELNACNSWEQVFNALKPKASSAGRPESLPKWAMSALLWYATEGKYGRSVLHMLPFAAPKNASDNFVTVKRLLDDKNVPVPFKCELVSHLLLDPNPERVVIWQDYKAKYGKAPLQKLDPKAVREVYNGTIKKVTDYVGPTTIEDVETLASELAKVKAELAKAKRLAKQAKAANVQRAKKANGEVVPSAI